MNNNGWIKLHRSSMNMLKNHKQFAIWCYCLLKASHTKQKIIIGFQEVELQPGDFIFGTEQMSKDLGIPRSTIKRVLLRFKRNSMLVLKPTNKFTVGSVVNWAIYQEGENKNDQQMDNKWPTSGQQVDTYKNDKNEKNDKNIYNIYIRKFQKFFERRTKINITKQKDVCLLVKTYPYNSLIQLTLRVQMYFYLASKEKWKNFVFAKRWNKIVENINIFIDEREFKKRITQMREWNQVSTKKMETSYGESDDFKKYMSKLKGEKK